MNCSELATGTSNAGLSLFSTHYKIKLKVHVILFKIYLKYLFCNLIPKAYIFVHLAWPNKPVQNQSNLWLSYRRQPFVSCSITHQIVLNRPVRINSLGSVEVTVVIYGSQSPTYKHRRWTENIDIILNCSFSRVNLPVRVRFAAVSVV